MGDLSVNRLTSDCDWFCRTTQAPHSARAVGHHRSLAGRRLVRAPGGARVRRNRGARPGGGPADRVPHGPVARALRGGRTGLVGVIGGSLADYWHQEFVSHLQRHLAGHGLRVLLADAGGDPDAELGLAEDLVGHRVDGLVVLPLDPAGAGWSRVATATPTVAVNGALPPPARSIGLQPIQASARARPSHELGHGAGHGARRRPAPRAPPQRAAAHPLRAQCGRRPPVGDAVAAPRGSVDSGLRPLRHPGLRGLRGMRRAGRDIPGDLSVVGFDDHPVSALLRPPLTTVGWDTEQAAAWPRRC